MGATEKSSSKTWYPPHHTHGHVFVVVALEDGALAVAGVGPHVVVDEVEEFFDGDNFVDVASPDEEVGEHALLYEVVWES